MDGWSSSKDSYHIAVERTSIMLKKGKCTPHWAVHADFPITPWGTVCENTNSFDYKATCAAMIMSKAIGEELCLHFVKIKSVIEKAFYITAVLNS